MKVLFPGAAILLAVFLGSGCATSSVPTRASETRFTPIASQLLFSVRYEDETREMTVVRMSGEVTDFLAVPRDVYEGLLQAEDPDAYFRDRIASIYEERPFEF